MPVNIANTLSVKSEDAGESYRILFTLPSGTALIWKYASQVARDTDYSAILNLQYSSGGGGGTTPADVHYVHTQSMAATTWNVTHNLDCYPPVSVVDSSDDEVYGGQVHYTDSNNLTITFPVAFGGKAYM